MNPSSMLSNRTEEDSSRRKVLQDIADSGVSAKSKFQYLALVLNCVLVNEELTPVVELPDFVGQFRPLCLGKFLA